MSIIEKTILSKDQPQNTNVLWAKPKEGGGIELNAFNNGKWENAGGESTQEPLVVEMFEQEMPVYRIEIDAHVIDLPPDDLEEEDCTNALVGSITATCEYYMHYTQPLMPYEDFVRLLRSGKPVDLLSPDKKITYHITSYEVLDQKDWEYYDHYDYEEDTIRVYTPPYDTEYEGVFDEEYVKEYVEHCTEGVCRAIIKQKYTPTIHLEVTANDIEEFPSATSIYNINLRWWDVGCPQLSYIKGKVEGINNTIDYKGHALLTGLDSQNLGGSPIIIHLDENNESTITKETIGKAFRTHPVYFSIYDDDISVRVDEVIMGGAMIFCRGLQVTYDTVRVQEYSYDETSTEGKYRLNSQEAIIYLEPEPGEDPEPIVRSTEIIDKDDVGGQGTTDISSGDVAQRGFAWEYQIDINSPTGDYKTHIGTSFARNEDPYAESEDERYRIYVAVSAGTHGVYILLHQGYNIEIIQKLYHNNIEGDQIASEAITYDKIADNAVRTNKIADKAVTTAKLAADVQAELGKIPEIQTEVSKIGKATPVTYVELKSLRDNSKLIPGGVYRITDYQCTTTQTDTQSANHQFDIIVTADLKDRLNEAARAVRHDNDKNLPDATDGTAYFANSKLEAWKIWYCLDNDASRFDWADVENGKGVIYRMIDEFNNDVPYDFKNIQFKRYKVTYSLSSRSAMQGKYCGIMDISFGDYSDQPLITIDHNDYSWVYTFGYDFDYSTWSYVSSIRILPYIERTQKLNNICFNSDPVLYDYYYIRNISFGHNCSNCTIGSSCADITIGESGNNLYILSNSYGISIGNSCSCLFLGIFSLGISYGNYCNNITLENNNTSISFGSSCSYITIGANSNGTFGNNLSYIACGANVGSVSVGRDCHHIFIGVDSYGDTTDAYCSNLKIDSGARYIHLNTSTSGSYARNYHITSGMKFDDESPYVLNMEPDRNYETTVAINSKGEVVEYCEADLINNK